MKKYVWLFLLFLLALPVVVNASIPFWTKQQITKCGTNGAAMAWFTGSMTENNGSIDVNLELKCGKKHGGTMESEGRMSFK